ncbi:hypothetical protein N0V82_006366 [Gnomoniopsis sp. IMI 355080]|nr:hypothetical protein N0V82_006366 [Gnomoniopsis sp. IMI 355080]
MPPRKSDSQRRSDTSASTARFAPIEDHPPAPAAPSLAMQAPTFAPGGPALGPSASPALALPTMDPTSMPPPSLPPPGSAQTPDVVAFAPRPGSAAAPVPSGRGGSAPSQTTPSEKGKDKEEGKTGPGGHPKEAITIPIEELQLPKSIITRLAKGVLPPNTQIQANAILAMTKSATVFINHLANAANEVTTLQNKKTIMPADVFRALDDIEYGFMRERVEAEFAKFNETQTTKRSAYRKKVAVSRKGKGSGDGADASMAETDGDTTMGGADATVNSAASTTGADQHRTKKARTDGTGEGMDVDEEQDASDPESVPNEDDDDEDAQEEEEEGEDDQEAGQEEMDQDALEERENRVDEDEALDDGNHSD